LIEPLKSGPCLRKLSLALTDVPAVPSPVGSFELQLAVRD
jgi:hypothetical protein